MVGEKKVRVPQSKFRRYFRLTRNRAERGEGVQVGKLAPNLLHNGLDQEVAHVDPPEPGLRWGKV